MRFAAGGADRDHELAVARRIEEGFAFGGHDRGRESCAVIGVLTPVP